MPRIQLTIRVVVGSILVTIPFLVFVVGMSLPYFIGPRTVSSRRTDALGWDAGAAPSVVVAVAEGSITVSQAGDGRVSASLTKLAVVEGKQADADAALAGIVVTATQDGGTIRIEVKPAPDARPGQYRADLDLKVPPGAAVDLRIGSGPIAIGKVYDDPYRARLIAAPVALREARVRPAGEGFVAVDVAVAPRPGLPATVLDLASRRGAVTIRGDDVVVAAVADDGGIDYGGRLAPGVHRFRAGPEVPGGRGAGLATAGIRLALSASSAPTIDARSRSGRITSDFPGAAATGPEGATFASPPGLDAAVRVEVRTDAGSIEIRKEPARARPTPPPTGSSRP